MTSGPPGGGTWTGVAVTVGGVLAMGLLVLAIPELRTALSDAVSGDTAEVREDLRGLGAGAVALVFALAMIHTVVWYPAEILDGVAGFLYGFGWGLVLMMACWLASGLLAFYIGRHAGRPLLYRLAGRERFERLADAIERGGATILLAARLIPIVPFSLTGLVAGAVHVPLWRFMWTTAVGYTPLTAYFVYLGSRVEDFSIEDPILWIGAIALLAAILGVRYLIPRLAGRDLD